MNSFVVFTVLAAVVVNQAVAHAGASNSGRPTPEELKAKFDALPQEQKDKLRARFEQHSSKGSGSGRGEHGGFRAGDGSSGRPTAEEMKAKFDALTPEQKDQLKARFEQHSSKPSGSGASNWNGEHGGFQAGKKTKRNAPPNFEELKKAFSDGKMPTLEELKAKFGSLSPPTAEEARARFESLTPEQQEKAKQVFGSGSANFEDLREKFSGSLASHSSSGGFQAQPQFPENIQAALKKTFGDSMPNLENLKEQFGALSKDQARAKAVEIFGSKKVEEFEAQLAQHGGQQWDQRDGDHGSR